MCPHKCILNVSKWRHHSQYRPYWRIAWQMHTDGTVHADCLAYLHALCCEHRKYTGRDHVGYRVWQEIQLIQEESETANHGEVA